MVISFRQLERDDFTLLADWFARPHVQPWWQEAYDLDSIETRYGSIVDRTDPTEVIVIEQDGEPIGMIQRYRIDDNPDWKESLRPVPLPSGVLAGIDYLIGVENLTGHGLGSQLIDSFVVDTWHRWSDVEAIVVTTDQQNRRSWRALEKCDFNRIWAGQIVSEDPSDSGPSYAYIRRRS